MDKGYVRTSVVWISCFNRRFFLFEEGYHEKAETESKTRIDGFAI